jgi:hypothetical protein
VWKLCSCLVLLSGCSSGPDPPAPARVLNTSFEGALVPACATLTVTLSGPIDPATVSATTVLLTAGEADPPFSRAVEHPPPTAREWARLVPLELAVDGARLSVAPRRALEARARHTLGLGPSLRAGDGALERAVLIAFDTAGAP